MYNIKEMFIIIGLQASATMCVFWFGMVLEVDPLLACHLGVLAALLIAGSLVWLTREIEKGRK